MWSRGCWGWQGLCKSFLKVHLKIRNEEKKREKTVGQNEGKEQQEAEKNQCKEQMSREPWAPAPLRAEAWADIREHYFPVQNYCTYHTIRNVIS